MMWLIIHSAVVTGLSVALFAGTNPAVVAAALVTETLGAFVWLFAEGGRPAVRVANGLTAFRLTTALVGLAAVARAVGPSSPGGRIIFWILVAGEITDLADGAVARRRGPTAFGARLDMETDAVFILALSIVCIAWHGLPTALVGAGLLRFALAIPFFLLPDRRFPRGFSVFAKSACAAAAILLLVSLFPPLDNVIRWLGVPLTAATIRTVLTAGAFALLTASFGWETVLRVSNAVQTRKTGAERGRAAGLVRSFLTYYGVPFRLVRTRRFYRQFVASGDLVLDVGAHVGNRVRAFRGLGARVVAVEPQSSCLALLTRLFRSDAEVLIEPVACGGTSGTAVLRVDPGHPTLATLSDRWISSIDNHYGEIGIDWRVRETVRVRTLDDLVSQYGTPSFIKIDVEGFEAQALRGLHTAVRAVSFEFLPAAPESALESINELTRLGDYRFNYSMVESMRMASTEWVDACAIRTVIESMPSGGRSGDVYAVLNRETPER